MVFSPPNGKQRKADQKLGARRRDLVNVDVISLDGAVCLADKLPIPVLQSCFLRVDPVPQRG